ncbi:MAG: DUF1614 domain-containing protein [Bacillota bacterium]|nr:MAG: DUF1614 domain-containing protein [Bacillota bacterium]
MPVGVIVLLIIAILVYFGVLHRVLDRMRLDDRTALFIIFLMIVGSFFNITLLSQPVLRLNVGGAIIPIGVAVYLIVTADTRHEKIRGTLAAVVSGAVIYLAFKFLNPEEQTMIIDPTYFFAIIAGVVGYLSGRSRRASFIAGSAGVVLADIGHFVEVSARGIPAATWVGGAGVFDASVIAGLLAVVLAEAVGESRELLARGPMRDRDAEGPAGRRREEEREGRDNGHGGNAGGPGGSGSRGQGRGGENGRGGESDRGGFVAAFGVAGGSGRTKGGRGSHRAGRRGRVGRDARPRPATSGGAGWEPPIVGDASGQEVIGSVTMPPSDLVTEPGESQAPATGMDLGSITLPGNGSRAGRRNGGRGGSGRRSRGNGRGRKGGGGDA